MAVRSGVQRKLSALWTAFLLRRKGGRLAAYLNLQVTTWRNGRRVVVPLNGGVGFDNLVVSERWMDRILPVLLQHKPGAFIDVGANVGQTLLKLKALSPQGEYLGFEPNPVCFNYTQNLITVNRFEHCTLLPVGLSSSSRVLPLFGRSQADVSGSVVAGFRPQRRSPPLMHVAVFEGDELLEWFGRPAVGVLKIDVEGGELEVVQGLRSTIGHNRPFILCEILPLFSLESETGRFRATRQRNLLSIMREADYVMYRVSDEGTAQPLQDVECHSDMALTNYLFAPVEAGGYLEGTIVASNRTTGESATGSAVAGERKT